MRCLPKGELEHLYAGGRASYCGVRVRLLREWGQGTAGVGARYCGVQGITKGEAVGHTTGYWASL